MLPPIDLHSSNFFSFSTRFLNINEFTMVSCMIGGFIKQAKGDRLQTSKQP